MKKLNAYKISALTVLGISAVLAAARTALLVYNIEIDKDNSSIGYYIQSNTMTVFFVVAVAACTIGIIIWNMITVKKDAVIFDICTEQQSIPSSVIFTSALSGFMLLTTGIYYISLFLRGDIFTIYDLVLALLMMLSSMCFLYNSLFKIKKRTVLFSALYIFPVITIIYRLITDFVKQKDYPTTSTTAFYIISLICLMLFLTYECKNSVKAANTKLYVTMALLSVMYLLIFAVPNLILSAFWLLELNEKILISAIDIVFALYAFSKAYSVTNPTE